MNKIKKVIIIMICIIIILLIATIIIIKNRQDGDLAFFNKEIEEQELVEEPENVIQISDYFIIKDCVQNYFDFLNKNNSIYYDMQDDGNQTYNEGIHKEIVYSLLNENFIKRNSITTENVFKYVENIESKQRFYPIEIKKISGEDVVSFKVYGIMQNLDYRNAKKVYCIVDINYNNNAFCIYQLDETLYENYQEEKIDKIDKKEYNTYNLEQISAENIAVEYFEAYKFLTLANPQFTYNLMTEEYKNKRFGSLDNYNQYIKDNLEEIKGIVAKKYLTNNTDDGIQYVVQDQNENMYIFDVKSTMDYTIKLDTYTLDEEKFITTYNNADESQRVQMNIGKFFDMINRHDYRTSYNCLAEEFKKGKFKNEKEFENTIKEYLFENNNYIIKELNSVGSKTYACKIEVTGIKDEYERTTKMTIIMQLLEGTDFVMSFSMD